MTTMTATSHDVMSARRRQPPGLMVYGLIVMGLVFGPTAVALALLLMRTH